MLLVLLLPNTSAQDYREMSLPDGAIARIGKGESGWVLYSPDGSRLAVVSTIGIRLYDTATYREIALLAGHTHQITDVSFSLDGATLVSASYDATIQLWDVKTGRHKQTLTGHTEGIEGVVFSPDRATLASWSWDQTVRLLSLIHI